MKQGNKTLIKVIERVLETFTYALVVGFVGAFGGLTLMLAADQIQQPPLVYDADKIVAQSISDINTEIGSPDGLPVVPYATAVGKYSLQLLEQQAVTQAKTSTLAGVKRYVGAVGTSLFLAGFYVWLVLCSGASEVGTIRKLAASVLTAGLGVLCALYFFYPMFGPVHMKYDLGGFDFLGEPTGNQLAFAGQLTAMLTPVLMIATFTFEGLMLMAIREFGQQTQLVGVTNPAIRRGGRRQANQTA